MKKYIALFILIGSLIFSAKAESGLNNFQGTFSEALAKAKEQNKLVFIDCFTTWCGPCKWMDAHVFTNDSVYNYFNSTFVCYRSDMEKGEGLDIAKRYGIKNYPTFLWIDGDGKQIHRSVGSTPVASFLDITHHATSKEGNLAWLGEQYKAGSRKAPVLLAYANALKDAYDMSYQTVIDEYFHAQSGADLASKDNWKAILEFTPNMNSYIWSQMVKEPKTFYERYGKDSVDHVMDNLALQSLSFASQQKDSILLEKAVSRLKQSNNKEVLAEAANGELDYYKHNKNMVKYTALAHDYVNKYLMSDAKTLNAICWTYFMKVDNKQQLAEAEKWIAQSVKLDDAYYNTDTYANILDKEGKKKEAIDMAKHSIDMAKKSGEDSSSTQELLDKMTKGQ